MRKFFPLIFLLLVVLLLAVPAFIKQSTPRKNLPQGDPPGYWVVDMGNNKYLTHTSVPLSVGDEYLSADNKVYRITKIVADKAYVQRIE
ncbi:hypothetical protein [Candidatus Formimonas warabiya]|uniref:Uncharacterized protein n=1 Tax=Formimonas warabiya TaxID=1761012 RepID=A0A3G1KUZ1_FORW1|nr:hypothetical protein [Candidatus Formimonas warabiya]ATW26269.1 hypothetical protein DCMF_17235 [Candidatus Formimonas warabiya]